MGFITSKIDQANYLFLFSCLAALLPLRANAAVINITCPLTVGYLQKAIDSASSGDTINISGTCAGPITINKALTLNGVRQDNVFPIIDAGGSTTVGDAITINSDTTASTVTLQNLTIQNAYNGIQNNHNLNTDNLIISHCLIQKVGFGYDQDVSPTAGSLSIVNNTFSDYTQGAVRLGNEKLNDLSSNTMYSLYPDSHGLIASTSPVTNFSRNFIISLDRGVTSNGGVVTSSGYNVLIGGAAISYYVKATTDQLLASDTDAGLFYGLADNGGATMTYALEWWVSPAFSKIPLNTISETGVQYCPATTPSASNSYPVNDQRGAPRPGVGKSHCDIGAYETGQPRLSIDSPVPVLSSQPPTLNMLSVGGKPVYGTIIYKNSGNAATTMFAPWTVFQSSSAFSYSNPTSPSRDPLLACTSRTQEIKFYPSVYGGFKDAVVITAYDLDYRLIGTYVNLNGFATKRQY